MRSPGVVFGASALLCALVACEPQAVRLFDNVAPLPASPDAGTPPVADTDTPPAPPSSIEQPACLTDACRSCVAVGCIVAGARWLCHPVTGECALPCEPVSDSSQCPREQSCHPDLRLCVDCRVNADCGAAACDTERNVCVECTSETQCSAPTPACDTDAQRCVACRANRHCGVGFVCNTDAQTCVQCLVADDCAGTGLGDDLTPACDTSRNVCVECLSDDDCTSDPEKPFCKVSEFECDDELGGG